VSRHAIDPARRDGAAPGSHQRSALTFVTVVFEPELALLRLQARSLACFLDEACVEELIVLDNCAGGMRARARRAVLAQLGPTLAPRTTFVRTADLGVRGGTQGWRSQQAAKLLIASRIRTPHYVILDAKNHLVAPVGAGAFVDDDGRARGGTHPYTAHPLRADLERTLRYLGADDADVARALTDFPPTATPFVVDTALARRMIHDIEDTAGEPFAVAFERGRLLEFFLYSGWSMRRGPGVPVNGEPIRSEVIWPARATAEGARSAIDAAIATGAPWFSVHRRVLARADADARRRIAEFWVARGLMTSAEAERFMRRFRLSYVPAVGWARIAERLQRLRGR
jgi:hypothetical protein